MQRVASTDKLRDSSMFTRMPDLITAYILLTSPVGTPCPPVTEETFPPIAAGVKQLAIEWEVMDNRESRYMLVRTLDFQSDINLLQRRVRDLADSPLMSASLHYPTRAECNAHCKHNRDYRRHLELRMELEHDRKYEFEVAIAECDRLYRVWDAVRDAGCEYYYVSVRREALARLRDMGYPPGSILPPSVPVWRMTELR